MSSNTILRRLRVVEGGLGRDADQLLRKGRWIFKVQILLEQCWEARASERTYLLAQLNALLSLRDISELYRNWKVALQKGESQSQYT